MLDAPRRASVGSDRTSVGGDRDVSPSRRASIGQRSASYTVAYTDVKRAGLSPKGDAEAPANKQWLAGELESVMAHPNFHATLERMYPGALPAAEFLDVTSETLWGLGFRPENTLPCVALCRDEICRQFFDDVQERWKKEASGTAALGAFNMSSLAGLPTLGTTGLRAAISHAPVDPADGKERYVFLGMAHVALGHDGEVGECTRPGRSEHSHACGALLGVRGMYVRGVGAPPLNFDDVEMTLVAGMLFNKVPPKGMGEAPSLQELTRATAMEISTRLVRQVAEAVAPRKCDYAVLTGIQVHGPEGHDYVYPIELFAVVDGKRRELSTASAHVYADVWQAAKAPLARAASRGTALTERVVPLGRMAEEDEEEDEKDKVREFALDSGLLGADREPKAAGPRVAPAAAEPPSKPEAAAEAKGAAPAAPPPAQPGAAAGTPGQPKKSRACVIM
eukprot:tig00000849_g4769.t1